MLWVKLIWEKLHEVWLLRFFLKEAHNHGKINLLSHKDLEKYCGLIILRMEKFGADEFYYSSDIDLILHYEYDDNAEISDRKNSLYPSI